MNREIKFRAWEKSFHKMYFDTEYLMVCHDKIFYKYDGTEFKISNSNCDFMQFTGLLDKTGAEIYEGDIVNTPHNGIMKVLFSDGSFQMKKANGDSVLTWAYSSEIIGNIYQNPELLESVQK